MSLNQRIDEIMHEKEHCHFFKQYCNKFFSIISNAICNHFSSSDMSLDKIDVDQIEIVEKFDVRHSYRRTKTSQRFQESLTRHDEKQSINNY